MARKSAVPESDSNELLMESKAFLPEATQIADIWRRLLGVKVSRNQIAVHMVKLKHWQESQEEMLEKLSR